MIIPDITEVAEFGWLPGDDLLGKLGEQNSFGYDYELFLLEFARRCGAKALRTVT